MLFIVHIILYVFYPTSKANLFYSLWALVFTIGTIFLVAQYATNFIEGRNFNAVVTVLCNEVASIFLVYTVYALLKQKPKRLFAFIILLNIVAMFNTLFGSHLSRN